MRLSTIAATALCLSYNAVAISLPERDALPLLGEDTTRYADETLSTAPILYRLLTTTLATPSTSVFPSKNRLPFWVPAPWSHST
jgi:hypothetical protein